MKYLLSFIIAFSCLGCKEISEKANKSTIFTHKELKMAAASVGALNKPKPIESQKLSEDEIRTLFLKHDIKPFFYQADEEIYSTLNGFFGPDHYRIEFVFLGIEQDKTMKNKFYLTGKNRHKKQITDFEGSFIIDSVFSIKDPNVKDENFESEYGYFSGLKEKYSCVGKFTLSEDSSQQFSGKFEGRMALDFGINEDKKPEIWYYSNKTPARSSGFLFDGTWVNYDGGKSKSTLFSKDIFMFANDILKDFSYGEREIEINPKYRKLGWADFWQSEEWWVSDKKSM